MNQPNPFRRYEGAPLVQLPILGADEEPLSPRYEDLYRRGSVPSAPLTVRSLSRLFEYALALTAWKQAGHMITFDGPAVAQRLLSAAAER